MLLSQLLRDPVHVRTSLFDCDARLEPRDHIAAGADVAPLPIEWSHQDPRRRWSLMRETLGQHTNHRVRPVVERDVPADNIWIGGKALDRKSTRLNSSH